MVKGDLGRSSARSGAHGIATGGGQEPLGGHGADQPPVILVAGEVVFDGPSEQVRQIRRDPQAPGCDAPALSARPCMRTARCVAAWLSSQSSGRTCRDLDLHLAPASDEASHLHRAHRRVVVADQVAIDRADPPRRALYSAALPRNQVMRTMSVERAPPASRDGEHVAKRLADLFDEGPRCGRSSSASQPTWPATNSIRPFRGDAIGVSFAVSTRGLKNLHVCPRVRF